jgi:WD40 repeat protein
VSGQQFDAFISYARKDSDVASGVRRALGEHGQAVWIDVEGIVAGADWDERIMRAIEGCEAFVFLISPASVSSTVCQRELRQAVEAHKLVIPVTVRPVAPELLVRRLATPDTISIRDGDFDAGLDRLVDELGFDLDWRRAHTRLAIRSREWRDAGRDRSFVLRGSDLEQGEHWLGRQAEHAQTPTRGQAEYLVASRRAATARQRATLGGTAAAVLLTLALAAFALVQRDTAISDRRVAISKGLAARAASVAEQDPTLAAALSLEARRIQPTPEADRAIDAALATLGPSLGDLTGQTGAVSRAVVSPDGRTVAAAGLDKQVRMWDLATRAAIGPPLTGHTAVVGDLAYSPDGSTLASGSADKTIRLWDVATHRAIGAPLTGHESGVASVAFSPDGTRLASVGLDRTVRLWDLATRRPARAAVGRGAHDLLSVAYSPDGRLLATGDAAGTVQLRDAATNRAAGEPLRGHRDRVRDLAFSPDSALLATGSADGTARLWSVATRRPHGTVLRAGLGSVRGVAFSPRGETLATANRAGVQLWSVATGEPIGSPFAAVNADIAPRTEALGVAFTPDAKTLVAASRDATVKLWNVAPPATSGPTGVHTDDLQNPSLTAAQLEHAALRHDVAFSRDGKTLVTDDVLYARLLRLATRHFYGAPMDRHGGPVQGIASSPDGRLVATGSADGKLRLWSTATQARVGAPLGGRGVPATSLTFSPDSETLASAGADGTLRLWSVAHHRAIGSPLGRGISSVAFSPDGATLAGGASRTVLLWDVSTRRRVGGPLTGHEQPVSDVAFSPDGRTLAASAANGIVRLWDVATHRSRGTPMTGHTAFVFGIAFSADGRTLASAAADNTVRLWDIATQRPLGVPLVPREVVAGSVAFSPDGSTLVSVGQHAALARWDSILWNRRPSARRARLCASARRNLSRAEWSVYLPGEPYHATCPGL